MVKITYQYPYYDIKTYMWYIESNDDEWMNEWMNELDFELIIFLLTSFLLWIRSDSFYINKLLLSEHNGYHEVVALSKGISRVYLITWSLSLKSIIVGYSFIAIVIHHTNNHVLNNPWEWYVYMYTMMMI